jgi:hypothetical protein
MKSKSLRDHKFFEKIMENLITNVMLWITMASIIFNLGQQFPYLLSGRFFEVGLWVTKTGLTDTKDKEHDRKIMDSASKVVSYFYQLHKLFCGLVLVGICSPIVGTIVLLVIVGFYGLVWSVYWFLEQIAIVFEPLEFKDFMMIYNSGDKNTTAKVLVEKYSLWKDLRRGMK